MKNKNNIEKDLDREQASKPLTLNLFNGFCLVSFVLL